ncbi:MAG TPA: triose-phosphate isomerase [Candidatus Nanoarchaeia archaeon]|nr:triose-phosphate isomerase [Candidatus Nanoarchaeia archaeon]
MKNKPLILLNFKTYKEASGTKSLILAKKIAAARKNGYEIVIAPSLLTTKEIVDETNLTVFAQHSDSVELGAHTGWIPAQELVEIGVKGTILNHSEHKIPLKFLAMAIEECKKNGLVTVVCAATLEEVKKICALNPDYLAYEPKELIGGDVSVTTAEPDVIIKAVGLVKKLSPATKVLCGAGVHNKEDLGQALLLGTQGVLIGHSVPKSKDPKHFLEGMLL